MIIISFLLGIILSSLVEYLLHRFYLHQSNHSHLTKHHKDYNKETFSSNVKFNDVASSTSYIISNILLYGIILLIIHRFYPSFATLSLIFAIIYTLWIEYIHYEFHNLKKQNFKKAKWYKKLKNHHYKHHLVYRKNYNIGSRIWDIIFKTLIN